MTVITAFVKTAGELFKVPFRMSVILTAAGPGGRYPQQGRLVTAEAALLVIQELFRSYLSGFAFVGTPEGDAVLTAVLLAWWQRCLPYGSHTR